MSTGSLLPAFDDPIVDTDARLITLRQPRDVAELARHLASAIADAADADQWAIALRDISETGPPDFEELVPRRWLETLNGGGPTAYRLTLVLRTCERDLGILRLATLRPCGFSAEDIALARMETDLAAISLAIALDREATAGLAVAS